MKRNGAVMIRGLVSVTDLDQAYDEVKDRLNVDREWEGEFFPSASSFPSLFYSPSSFLLKQRAEETKRVNGLIGAGPAYTRTQAMNSLFQSLCTALLTARSTFWWGDTRKESVSKPYVTAAVAIQSGPGGKAQPLHGDSYVNHRIIALGMRSMSWMMLVMRAGRFRLDAGCWV
jgi:hypothetical protein